MEYPVTKINHKSKKLQRKTLRASMTPPELRMWNLLRNNNLGRKFRRQVSIGSYIVDFYCPSEKLIIEVDGSTHNTFMASDYDFKRDNFLRSLGLRVLRFDNKQVMNNLDGVEILIRDWFNY